MARNAFLHYHETNNTLKKKSDICKCVGSCRKREKYTEAVTRTFQSQQELIKGWRDVWPPAAALDYANDRCFSLRTAAAKIKEEMEEDIIRKIFAFINQNHIGPTEWIDELTFAHGGVTSNPPRHSRQTIMDDKEFTCWKIKRITILWMNIINY